MAVIPGFLTDEAVMIGYVFLCSLRLDFHEKINRLSRRIPVSSTSETIETLGLSELRILRLVLLLPTRYTKA
jgi:hypothetical protein